MQVRTILSVVVRPRCFPAVLVSLAVLLLVGCGRIPEGNMGVTGEVLMPDGSPYILGGAMRFEPDDITIRETRTSLGMLDDRGHFKLMTQDPNDGVPLGVYFVVLYVKELGGEAVAAVPDPYTHYETTPWQATVTQDGKNHFVFQIDDQVQERK